MSRHRYPTEICRVFERTTPQKLQAALKASEEQNDDKSLINGGEKDASEISTEKKGVRKGLKPSESGKNTNDGTRGRQATLKVVLGEALGYGPALSEHIILDSSLAPNMKLPKEDELDDETVQRLIKAVGKFEDWLQDVISGDAIPEGYILLQNKNQKKELHAPSETGSQVLFLFFKIAVLVPFASHHISCQIFNCTKIITD